MLVAPKGAVPTVLNNPVPKDVAGFSLLVALPKLIVVGFALNGGAFSNPLTKNQKTNFHFLVA